MKTFARPLSQALRTGVHAAVCLATAVAALAGPSLAHAQAEDRPVVSGGRAIGVDRNKDADDGQPAGKRAVTPDGKAAARSGLSTGTRPTLVFTIDVRWMGATSYRIERDLTNPIERAVKTLPGVKEVHSSSTGSRAQTLVTFDAKEDASKVATALRNRLDQIKTRLPHAASPPLIGWHREPPI